MKKAVIAGAGLTGCVIAQQLAGKGYHVLILERRSHIGGNMADETDAYGIKIHKYGPHVFHTNKKKLCQFMKQYEEWQEYHIRCGVVMNGILTPSPFNFQTIDDFYEEKQAAVIKAALLDAFGDKKTVTVTDALHSSSRIVREYAQFLFENDYKLYTAKQWGISPDEIDPCVLNRVPIRLDYTEGYFDDRYQMLPVHSYLSFFENLTKNKGIEIRLHDDALNHIVLTEHEILFDGFRLDGPFIFTGPIDELFGKRAGHLPYRSTEFQFYHEDIESRQDYPLVAYPQEDAYTRIVEYKKMQKETASGTTYSLEIPVPYDSGQGREAYYPVLTDKSRKQYEEYLNMARRIPNLILCGRLADFRYYNMDEALERAFRCVQDIL